MVKQAVRWFTLLEAAAYLGVSPHTLRGLIVKYAVKREDGSQTFNHRGIIGRKLGGRWKFDLTAWKLFVEGK